jgi:CheY-like chemotaxis protein
VDAHEALTTAGLVPKRSSAAGTAPRGAPSGAARLLAPASGLPVPAILAAMRPDRGPAGDWQASGLVLLAEDEDPVRRLTTAMLTELGFTVVPAADGVRALDVIRERRDELALVLLDPTMPEMTGGEILTEMESEGIRIPVILCSGHNARELSVRFAGRVVGFLQKPYRFEELRATVQKATATG